MGVTFSNLFSGFFEKKQFQIGTFGLDCAGKTTVLYQLKLGKVVKTIPTIGFNIETVEYKNVSLLVRDVGGGYHLRHVLARQMFRDMKALICVIDCYNRERIDEATIELGDMLEASLFYDSIVLILANKQDLPNAMSADELTERVEKVSQLRNRKWHVQSTSAITGEELDEGLDWLANEISKLP